MKRSALDGVGRRHPRRRRDNVKRFAALAIATLIAALDLWSKSAAESWLQGREPFVVTPFFNIALGYNSGVAFGALNDGGPGLVLGLTGLISLGVAIWMWRERLAVTRVALAFVLGGALGNLLDRTADGRVTDFLDAHLGTAHFPTFNLADVAITAGVLLLLLNSFGRAKAPVDAG